nr:urease accessory UreF family protein [Aureimonas sp. AU12]
MSWLSPAFPVGAFAYSHGLEAAVADGLLRTGEDVRGWIAALLRRGSGWNDLLLLGEAHRAVAAADEARLAEAADLAEALAGSAGRRTETIDLGAAFVLASQPWQGGTASAMPYPVAVGALAAASGIGREAALAAYAHAFTATLVSAAVRLVPLGQRDAVGLLHALEPLIAATARRAAAGSLDDLGSAAILSEIAAMRHETLVTRLFRT